MSKRGSHAGKTRVYLGMSFDGFIAGKDHDLSWLPHHEEAGDAVGFEEFMKEIGAMLLGQGVRLWDVHEERLPLRFAPPLRFGSSMIQLRAQRVREGS